MSYLELAKKVEEQSRQEPRPPQRAETAPKTRLWILLDSWSGMDEATWHMEAVDQIKNGILDLFKAHPEADTWFREWRAANPERRLA